MRQFSLDRLCSFLYQVLLYPLDKLVILLKNQVLCNAIFRFIILTRDSIIDIKPIKGWVWLVFRGALLRYEDPCENCREYII